MVMWSGLNTVLAGSLVFFLKFANVVFIYLFILHFISLRGPPNGINLQVP